MRFAIFLLASASAYAQTVSGIAFDGIGDSSVRVTWNTSATFNAYRIRYGTADCTSGSGQTVQTNNTNSFWSLQYGQSGQLSGLAPSTLYHVCPEVSSNGGSTYSSGVEGTFTTLARTQVLPDPPEPVSTDFPAQTGATLTVASDCSDLQAKINVAVPGDMIVVPAGAVCEDDYTTPDAPDAKTFTVLSTANSTIRVASCTDCFTDNQEVHFAAVANSNCLPGNKIFPGNAATSIPFFTCAKGGGINQADKYYLNKIDADDYQVLDAPNGTPVTFGFIEFTANAGADTITYVPTVNTPGGYQTQGFGSVGANTSIQFLSSGTLPGGLSPDTTYFLLTACAQSANAACTTQVSLTSGGSAVNITDTGTGTHKIVDVGVGTMYIAPAPAQDDDWILITSSGVLPPEGVRIDPSYDDEIFEFKKNGYDITPVFQPGLLAHNWRIAGAAFTGVQDDDYLTSTDPRAVCIGPGTAQHNRFISFDRVRIIGNSYPYRTGCRGGGLSIFWMGGYMSIINSDLRGLNYWRPWFGGSAGLYQGGGTGTFLAPTRVNGSQVTLSQGEAHLGKCTVVTGGTTTINFTGGTSSNTALVYVDMDCNLQVRSGPTSTGNCSTSGTITPGGGTPTCTFTATVGAPAYPVDGNGRRAALALATIAMSGGSVSVGGANLPDEVGSNRTGRAAYSVQNGAAVTEGANYLSAGEGPGPYLLHNNYISGSGLTIHFDDGGATFINRHDYTITQNHFDVDSSTQLFGADSDGFWYGNRQPLEWKSGQRILVSGNNFENCYIHMNPNGLCVVLTPISGGYMTDVEVSNNQYTNVGGCMQYASPGFTFMPASRPVQRQLFEDNICLTDGWTHYVLTEAQPRGNAFFGSNSMEDLTIRHNTIYNNLGNDTQFFHLTWSPIGGVSITDNFYFYTGNANMFAGEQGICGAQNNETMMNTCFTSGPGNTSYTFEGNVINPSWANTQTMMGGIVADATVSGQFSTTIGDNFIPTGANWNAKVSYIDWLCGLSCTGTTPNLQLAPTSPYLTAGTGGSQVGVDFENVADALGRVGTISITAITATTATVNIPAPSTFGCSVDWNLTGEFSDPYTRVDNAGGSTTQAVNLGQAPDPLPSNTAIYYRANCAVEQPTGSFMTSEGFAASGIGGPVKISGPAVFR